MDSPIQIITIQSPTGAHLLHPSIRDARTNRNNNNNNTNKSISNNSIGTGRIAGNTGKSIGFGTGEGGKVGGHNNRAGRGSKIIVIQSERNRRPQILLSNQRSMRLHVAPGAYPVYYGIARANGLFKGQIRAFKAKY